MQTRMRRRDVLRTVPGLLVYPALSAAQAPNGPGTGAPQIQLDASLNLNDPDIFEFIFDSRARIEGKLTLSDDDTKAFDVDHPGPSFIVGSTDQTLYGSKREYYAILEDNREINEVGVVIIYKLTVSLTITAILLYAKNLTTPQKDAITTAFSHYTPGTDPIKYAMGQIGPGSGIDEKMFAVRTSYRLDKKPNEQPTEYNASQRTRLLDLYNGKINGRLYGIKPGSNEPSSLYQYFKEHKVTVGRKIRDEVLTQIPEYKLDSLHQKDMHKPVSDQAADAAAQALADGDYGGLDPTVCKLTGADKRRIAAVFAWPEFKLEWVPVRVTVGCVALTLWLPRISVRVSDLVLFACMRHEQNLGQALVDMTFGCMASAGLAAVVAGVLANFAAAMATYLTVFNTCIAGQVTCLVPSLVLIVESSDWT